MRKRKGTRSEASRTLLNSASGIEEDEEALQFQHQNDNEGSEGDGFFACYLLTSLNPRYKGHTYIGFTVNPRRRIRQHNGEIGCGAWRTKKRRPWEMVLCIHGFPTNVSALQFEWAWQHPVESLAVRKAAAGFKSLSGIANKIKLAYTMLTLPSWQSMNITVNFFSTKYMKHCAGCPILPGHMKVKIGSMDELPCYTERVDGLSENEDDSIDEVEFDNNNNNTSNNDSLPAAYDDSIVHESPKNPNHGDKISESFGWNQESEAREPPGRHSFTSQDQSQPYGSIASRMVKSSTSTSLKRGEIMEDTDFMSVLNQESETREPPGRHSFTSQDQSQPYGSIASRMVKSSTSTSLKRGEIMEDTDFMSVLNKSSAVLSQPEFEQSDALSAANKNIKVSSTFIVPHEAEIIDLSTPSPSCRSVLSTKKRKVSSCVGADFIDLTKSPNFVQL